MSTALLVVDYQNDFLPGALLAVPDGHRVQPVLSRLARQDWVDVIVMSRDWHPPDHVSFSNDPRYEDFSWPRHCVQGTEGAKFDAILYGDLKHTRKPIVVVTKGDNQAEEAYSAFDGHTTVEEESLDPLWHDDDFPPPLVKREASLASVLDQQYGVHRVIVGGLALDYCVRATALDARDNGFQVTVPVEATRPVAYESGAHAIAELVEDGVNVV